MARVVVRVGEAAPLTLYLLGALTIGMAFAQQCTYESEPNDTVAAATRLTDAGPQPFGPDRYNEVSARCLTGEAGGTDEDVFRWEVTELDARHRWSFSLQGPADGSTSVVLLRASADGTVAEYERVTSRGGIAALSGEFLVEPGAYYLRVSAAGGAGEYVADVTPVIGLRYGAGEDRYDDGGGRRYTGAFGLYGPVAGELVQSFTIDSDGAKRNWGVELWAALGTEPRVELAGPSGVVAQGTVDTTGRARLPGLRLAAGSTRSACSATAAWSACASSHKACQATARPSNRTTSGAPPRSSLWGARCAPPSAGATSTASTSPPRRRASTTSPSRRTPT